MTDRVVYDESELERTMRQAFEDPNAYNIPRGIFRFDYETSHAWRVNIVRDKTSFVEYFHDSQSGSIENGLRRALLFRHEILSSFPMTTTWDFKRGLSQDPEKRIRRVTEYGHVSPYVFWRATWHDDQYRRKTKNFAVQRYGDDEAKRLALEAARANHNPVPKRYVQPDFQARQQWRSMLRAEVERKAARTNNDDENSDQVAEAKSSYPFGYEGEKRIQIHFAIERDRGLRLAKIQHFLAANGSLFCELCRFNFKKAYSFLTKDLIEVHHTTPLSTITSSTLVGVDDLMLLCPNCHTAIHQGDAVANLEAALIQFRPINDA